MKKLVKSRTSRTSGRYEFLSAKLSTFLPLKYPEPYSKYSNVIIHIGTNDSNTSKAKEIADKLFLLRKFVLSELSDCNVILSLPNESAGFYTARSYCKKRLMSYSKILVVLRL